MEIRERQRVGAQLRVEQDHSPRRQLVRDSLASIWSSVPYMSVKPSSRTCASELWLQRSTAVSRPTGGNGERTAGTSVPRRTRSLRRTTRLARNGRGTSVGPGEGAGVADGAPEHVRPSPDAQSPSNDASSDSEERTGNVRRSGGGSRGSGRCPRARRGEDSVVQDQAVVPQTRSSAPRGRTVTVG